MILFGLIYEPKFGLHKVSFKQLQKLRVYEKTDVLATNTQKIKTLIKVIAFDTKFEWFFQAKIKRLAAYDAF